MWLAVACLLPGMAMRFLPRMRDAKTVKVVAEGPDHPISILMVSWLTSSSRNGSYSSDIPAGLLLRGVCRR